MGQRYGTILPNPGSDGNHAEKHEKKGLRTDNSPAGITIFV